MIFVYIILCHVKRLCYTPTLVYTTAILYVYVCYTHCDIWLWIITSYTTLIYYTITIIITIILIYFYFFIFIIVLLCMCACMCCAVLSLLCVYVCSLVCPRICSYMCICVCVYSGSPSQTVLWWRGWCVDIGGGIFREKIFTKFGKWVYQVKTDRKSIFDLEKR